MKRFKITTLTTLFFALFTVQVFAEQTILNVSYDPTRELYQAYNALFGEYWAKKSGKSPVINQSHGGSGKQARAVIDGLEADVVTLALGYDIDAIAGKTGLINKNWQTRLPNNSCPYTSTIVFLVRKGNPKKIKDWSDLVKPGVSVISPNPKTSGGARWNYLAAWGYALKKNNNDPKKAQAFVKALFKNVPVLDSGARGSTMTFAKRGIGDVLLAWENEAYLALDEFGKDQFEIVYPSLSILAEPPVAVVDKNVKKHKTEQIAQEYLKYLYSKEAQHIIAANHFRPTDKTVAKQYAQNFPSIKLFTVKEVFGSWSKAQSTHFNDGGVFDKLVEGK